MGVEKKYQHLVPCVYMKQWNSRPPQKVKNSHSSVTFTYKYNKNNIYKDGEEVDIRTIGGKIDNYTVFEDSLCRTKEDIEKFLNGTKRILDIEDGFQEKMEKRWTSIVSKINNDINNNGCVTKKNKKSVNEFEKENIITFMTCMVYRAFNGIENYRKFAIQAILNNNNLKWDIKLKLLKILLYDEEIIKNLLLADMRKFLKKDDKSLIYTLSKFNSKNAQVIFMIVPEGYEFLTSDNPSIECEMSAIDKGIKGKVHIMPINTKVLAMLVKNDDMKKFKKWKINEDIVKNINRLIVESSVEFIISSRKTIKELI
nr:DUF4238 domain-containing protein [uncultured Romboutsia sp.]